jgi:hypothetical protein
MASNKYDQAAQAQFINTYVPIPFEQMMQAGQAKQNRYDKASMAVDSAIGAAEQIEAIPFSDDERRAKEYIANMRAVRDEFVTKDLSDPFVQREMSNKLRTAVNTEDIKHIQQSHQGYVAYNKELSDNESKGIPTPDFKKQKFEGYDSRKGVFTGNASTYKDPQKELDDFFKPLEVTNKGSFREKINGKETGYISNLLSIDANDIETYTKANLKTLINGPAMRDVIAEAESKGDTRSKEEISLEYVRANSQNRVKSAPGTYRQDLEYKNSGNKSDGMNNNFSTHIPYGIDEEEADPLSKRKVTKEVKKLEEQLAQNPNDTRLKNNIGQIHAVQEEAANTPQGDERISVNQKIEHLQKDISAETLNKTVLALTKNGMSTEEAIGYIQSNLSDSKNPDEQNVTPYLKARFENLADAIIKFGGKMQTRKDYIKSIAFSNDFKKDTDLKNSLINYYDTLGEGDKSNEQILLDYKKASNNIENQIKEQEHIKTQIQTDAFNKLRPSQTTYTELNGMFKFNQGAIRGSYVNNDGSERVYESKIGRDVGNFIYNMKDHQSQFYDMKGEKLSQKKQNNLFPILRQEGGFMITGIDDEPTANTGALVTVHLLNKDSKPTGEKFKVELPMQRTEDLINITNELDARGQNETAFSLMHLGDIRNLVESVDLFGGGSIPLSKFGISNAKETDNISFKRSGTGLIPIITKGDQVVEITKYGPVSKNNLPNVISEYLQRLVSQ